MRLDDNSEFQDGAGAEQEQSRVVVLRDRFQLIRKLGSGGNASVYEADDLQYHRKVAIKILSTTHREDITLNERQLARSKREPEVLARFTHPNIVSFYDGWVYEDRHFIVMERVDGVTLKERINQGPIPLAEAARIVDQIASALDVIHKSGIVHRDIKPSNIMLQFNPATSDWVKLLDFGIARHSDDVTLTGTGMMIGSATYMSPEQFGSKPATAGSDVWSLGVLLYEMLSGEPPFQSPELVGLAHQITSTTPPPLDGEAAIANSVLGIALDKNPTDRFPSAGVMASALRDAINVNIADPPQGDRVAFAGVASRADEGSESLPKLEIPALNIRATSEATTMQAMRAPSRSTPSPQPPGDRPASVPRVSRVLYYRALGAISVAAIIAVISAARLTLVPSQRPISAVASAPPLPTATPAALIAATPAAVVIAMPAPVSDKNVVAIVETIRRIRDAVEQGGWTALVGSANRIDSNPLVMARYVPPQFSWARLDKSGANQMVSWSTKVPPASAKLWMQEYRDAARQVLGLAQAPEEAVDGDARSVQIDIKPISVHFKYDSSLREADLWVDSTRQPATVEAEPLTSTGKVDSTRRPATGAAHRSVPQPAIGFSDKPVKSGSADQNGL